MGGIDPGPCPICGAPHAMCTGDPGPIVIDQMPALSASLSRPPLVADAVQATLPPGSFTSATYRRPKSKK